MSKYKGNRNRSYSDEAKGGASAGLSLSSPSYTLPMVGPTEYEAVQGPMGYTYRDRQVVPPNLDRPQACFDICNFTLKGYKIIGAGSLVVNEPMNRVDDFWEERYPRSIELAESRDGYVPQTQSLNTVANDLAYHDHAMVSAMNLRVLWNLFNMKHYNEASYSMAAAFVGKRRRILDMMEEFDKVPLPSELRLIVDELSRVITPYPGGPFYFRLFNHYNLTFDAAVNPVEDIGQTGFTFAAADVGDLLDDIQQSLDEINLKSDDNALSMNADVRLIRSLANMLALPTGFGSPKGLEVDRHAWDMMFREAFLFTDTQGAGTDKAIGYPYTGGSQDAMIFRACLGDLSPMEWMGVTKVYAVKESVIDVGGDNVVYGCTHVDGIQEAGGGLSYFFTPEDQWEAASASQDMSAAAGCQAFLWKHPFMNGPRHMWSIAAIQEQEAEDLHFPVDVFDTHFHMPYAHIAEHYFDWLKAVFKVPMNR